MPTQQQQQHDDAAARPAETDFAHFYLQRATRELSEDLDKIRGAGDFKADSVPFLVHALRQGAAQFSAQDRRRVVSDASRPGSS